MDLYEAIKGRRSIRRFKPDPDESPPAPKRKPNRVVYEGF